MSCIPKLFYLFQHPIDLKSTNVTCTLVRIKCFYFLEMNTRVFLFCFVLFCGGFFWGGGWRLHTYMKFNKWFTDKNSRAHEQWYVFIYILGKYICLGKYKWLVLLSRILYLFCHMPIINSHIIFNHNINFFYFNLLRVRSQAPVMTLDLSL